MDLNRATLIGNVTRDPELRSTATSQSVCSFSVATNLQWTDTNGVKQQKTEFHNIVAWGKLAEICSQYLNKGKKIYVEGRLQTREWEGQDGAKRRTTEIVAENMIMLDRGGQTGAGAPTAAPPSAPKASINDTSVTIDKGVGDQEIRLEDIPF